jgi:hypothetical protein
VLPRVPAHLRGLAGVDRGSEERAGEIEMLPAARERVPDMFHSTFPACSFGWWLIAGADLL